MGAEHCNDHCVRGFVSVCEHILGTTCSNVFTKSSVMASCIAVMGRMGQAVQVWCKLSDSFGGSTDLTSQCLLRLTYQGQSLMSTVALF